ncbi:MAG: hypothetical protein QM781_12410 [Chitinophagaceae bacterium]
MKKNVFFIYCLLAGLLPYAQQPAINWTSLICSDSTNFTLTRFFGDSMPSAYFFLDSTQTWNLNRFKLKEDVHDPAILKKIARDEHHPYHHSYIFRDSILDRTFTATVKEQLYQSARQQKAERLSADNKVFSLMKKYEDMPAGFFFVCSTPLFTPDQQYCFIDLGILHKTAETTGINDAYFGTILLIYRKDYTGQWKRWRKMEHLIL